MDSMRRFASLDRQAEGTTLLNLERACSSVRPEAMATYIWGGRAELARRMRLIQLVESDPVFDREDRHFQEQTQRFSRAVEKSVHLIKKCQALKLSWDDFLFLTNAAVDEVLPIDVHTKMFVPALEYQTTPEQRDKWLPLAKQFRILGAYAQTELGHGSNVRALETTARYDPETQTFELQSPTLTSLKWWPGGLGKVATHAVVLARLLVAGKDHGLQSFLVPLRSLVDHTPLPGVSVGDIGPKMGFQAVDNGFLRLDHVRIPRDYMLMGLAEVTADGKLVKKASNGGEKILYGAMLDVRAGLVERAAVTLARALTVAIRYSAVRKQGFVGEADPQGRKREQQVLDYPTQMHTLMPLLAWAYALQATGAFMHGKYRDYLKELDLSLLPEVHALSSGLKALAAKVVSDGIETCRKMCGGHGYSNFSGLPELVTNYVPVNTFEGTQQVLEPQTARYLLRIASGVPPSAPSTDLDYLARAAELIEVKCPASSGQDLLDPELQIQAFECRAAAVLAQASQEVTALTASGASLVEAVNASGVVLGKLSRAHCQLIILKRFHESVAAQEERIRDGVGGGDVEVGAAETRVLRELVHLFALSVMEQDMADFRARDYMTAAQADMAAQEVMRLCRSIRLDSVALVDSWLLSDKLLNSALGRSDGKVYEALVDLALRSPLNEHDVTPSYHTHIVQLTRATHSTGRL